METKPRSLFNNALIYGLLTAALSIAFSIVTYALDVPFKSPIMYLSFIFLLAGIVYGTMQYRDKTLGGYISFGKAFQSAFLILVIAVVLTTIYSYIFMTIIDPSFVEKIAEQALEKAETDMISKGISEDQMGPALEMTKKFLTPGMMTIMGLLSNLVFGAILSLISAAFTKKENKSFESQFKDVE